MRLLRLVGPIGDVDSRTIIKHWARFAVLLLVITGLFAIAYFKAASTADCVNQLLGDRSDVTANDTRAHIQHAKDLEALLSGPQSEGLERFNHFKVQLAKYRATLVADQAYRDAHPLGEC